MLLLLLQEGPCGMSAWDSENSGFDSLDFLALIGLSFNGSILDILILPSLYFYEDIHDFNFILITNLPKIKTSKKDNLILTIKNNQIVKYTHYAYMVKFIT